MVQESLDELSIGLTDPKVWRLVVKDESEKAIAVKAGIEQMEVVANLLSVRYPNLTVQLVKHNLIRRAYRSGRVIPSMELFDIKTIIPDISENEERSWMEIS